MPYNNINGSRSGENLTTKEIAKLLREHMKIACKKCKFSITTDYNSISVYLMEAPFEALYPEYMQRGYTQVNQHRISSDESLTPKAQALLGEVHRFLSQFNHNHSDTYTDYFDVGFYESLGVGKYDKPFKLVR